MDVLFRPCTLCTAERSLSTTYSLNLAATRRSSWHYVNSASDEPHDREILQVMARSLVELI